jgi:hypothetical protein
MELEVEQRQTYGFEKECVVVEVILNEVHVSAAVTPSSLNHDVESALDERSARRKSMCGSAAYVFIDIHEGCSPRIVDGAEHVGAFLQDLPSAASDIHLAAAPGDIPRCTRHVAREDGGGARSVVRVGSLHDEE